MSKESDYLVAEATPVDEAPKHTGSWKTSLCGCCKYGGCHKALLCALWFPTLLMGQLLTRMKMSFLGEASTAAEEYKKTFRIVAAIYICYSIILSIFGCDPDTLEESDDGEIVAGVGIVMVPDPDCAKWQQNLTSYLSSAMYFYMLIVMIRLRVAIRTKYSIPEENCSGCEDCCCIFWCGCCSAVQMAHQTADYENEEAYCLTTTGLPPTVNSNEQLTQAIVV